MLRRWRRLDTAALERAVHESLDHLRPWMPWVAAEPLTRAQRRALVGRLRRDWRLGTDYAYGLFADGQLAGSVGLHRRQPGCLEIGYWVRSSLLGRGFAPRAAAGLTTAALCLEGVGWVEIHHDRANRASRRIPEKLGFHLVAEEPDAVEAPGESGVSCVWRIYREEWQDPFGWRLER